MVSLVYTLRDEKGGAYNELQPDVRTYVDRILDKQKDIQRILN